MARRITTAPEAPKQWIFPPAVPGTCVVVRRAPAHGAGYTAGAPQRSAPPRRTGTTGGPGELLGGSGIAVGMSPSGWGEFHHRHRFNKTTYRLLCVSWGSPDKQRSQFTERYGMSNGIVPEVNLCLLRRDGPGDRRESLIRNSDGDGWICRDIAIPVGLLPPGRDDQGGRQPAECRLRGTCLASVRISHGSLGTMDIKAATLGFAVVLLGLSFRPAVSD